MKAIKKFKPGWRRGPGLVAGVGCLGLSLLTSTAADWPQYRGPNHDGISTDRILKSWPAQGPRQVWKTPLTYGFSSFAVSGGQAFTLVRRTVNGAKQEVCVALDAGTGQEQWATPLEPAKYDAGGDTGASGNTGGDGPRTTPSLDGNKVYVLTSHLALFCLEAATGKVLWSKDLEAQYGGSVISWQNGASPLIDGDLLFVNVNAPNQCLVALNKADGREVWKGLDYGMTQATPVAATIKDVRQIIFFTQYGLVSVVPATGAVLWKYAHPYNTSTAASPVVAGDVVYASAGYDVGAVAVKVTKSGDQFTAQKLWRKSRELMNHWSTPVHLNGYLYGLYGHGEYGTAPLQCVELATGRLLWSRENFGPGGVLVVDGQILVLSDSGDLVLVEPNPSAYTELARFHAVAGKCWNSPAVSQGRIYARSTKEGVCLDVAEYVASPLRLQTVGRQPDGRIQLEIGNSDSSAVDPTRAAKLTVRASADLSLDRNDWTPLPSALEYRDGVWRLVDPDSGKFSQRFYIVVEQP